MGVKMKEGITIVIPVKNRAHLIARCLDSIAAQTYRPVELIVVDNESTDSTVKIVEEWTEKNCDESLRLRLFSEKTPGASAARNCGLDATETEWVYFFDSDDMLLPHFLSDLMTAIGQNPGVDLIYWKVAVVDADNHAACKIFSTRNHWKRQIYNSILSTQAFAVRTEFLRKAGGWNPDMIGWNDWELGVRLLLGDPKLLAIPKVMALIYPQKESITGTNFHSKHGVWEDSILACESAVKNSNQDESTKRRLLSMLNYRRVILAAHYRREGRDDLAHPLLAEGLKMESGIFRSQLLNLIYIYTSKGGRGAYRVWR